MQIRVIAFPGAPNLPMFAAETHRCFKGEDLEVEFQTTPSSVHQFKEFAAGRCDIAFTAFDNVVAYREGQGAVKLEDAPDFRAVLGCTQIELSVVVAPEITSAEDLRARSIALDAPGTGFAFALYDMLAGLGLEPGAYDVAAVGATPERWRSVKAGEHAATLTIEPFTSLAKASGFKVLTRSTDRYSAYQGGVVAVRRDWAHAHGDALRAFLRSYLRALAWVLDPANRDAAAALLAERMPEVAPALLPRVMDSLLDPRSGLTPSGAILPDGVRKVLELRSRFAPAGAALTDPERYLDVSWAP